MRLMPVLRGVSVFILLIGSPVSGRAAAALGPWPRALSEAFARIGPERLERLPVLDELSALDLSKPYNQTRLEPLISRLELSAPSYPLEPEALAAMPPAALEMLLAGRALDARHAAVARARRMIEEIRLRAIPKKELRAAYERTERILLLESPYLDRTTRKDLQATLTGFLARVRAQENAENDERLRRQREAWEREAAATDDTSTWPGPQSEDGAVLEEEDPSPLNINTRRGLRRGGPFSENEPNFPLSYIEEHYLPAMEKAVQDLNPYKFWMEADFAVDSMTNQLDDYFLRRIGAIGQLGPKSRETLKDLRRQSVELAERIEALRDELVRRAEKKGGKFNLPGVRGMGSRFARKSEGIDGVVGGRHQMLKGIERLEKTLDGNADAQWLAAAKAYESAEKLREESDGSILRHFFALDDYFTLRIRRAQKDHKDPQHLIGVMQTIKDGDIRARDDDRQGFGIPSMDSLRRLYLLARNQGNGKAVLHQGYRGLGLGSAAAIFAYFIYPLWPYGLLASAVAGALLAGAVWNIHRARRFERLSAVFR